MNIKHVLTTVALATVVIVNLQAQERVRTQKELDFFAAYHERDTLKALAVGEDFLKKYPIGKADIADDKSNGIEYGRVYYNMISARRSQVDANIKRFYEEIPFLALAELYYRQVQLQDYHKLTKPEDLVDRSRVLMAKLKTFENKKPAEFASETDEEWAKRYDGLYYRSALIHVHILRATKNVKEGMEYANQISSRFGYTITSFNEDYIALLTMAGEDAKVEKALEASVHANQASPELLALLKKFYLAKNKDANAFDAYVESLKSEEGKVELEKELVASMVKKSLPAFKVTDANGKVVSSNDWKGKIVVLDFFASWCSPCKASFPGMQMAQEKLAQEKDVVFYYIDCQERVAGYKEVVMKYMKDNNFPFNVLFDNEGDKGINNEVCKQLNVTAIPRKMILDKEGMVRFDMDSYFGSPTKLADEIKIMVNLVKKTK